MNASKPNVSRQKQPRAKTATDDGAQLKAFRKAARELGTDESEDRFNEALGKIARSKPKPKIAKRD